MFIPFKSTKEERKTADDPRLSVEERYRDRERYLKAVRTSS